MARIPDGFRPAWLRRLDAKQAQLEVEEVMDFPTWLRCQPRLTASVGDSVGVRRFDEQRICDRQRVGRH